MKNALSTFLMHFKNWLSTPYLSIYLAVIATILMAKTIDSGFTADDHIQRNIIQSENYQLTTNPKQMGFFSFFNGIKEKNRAQIKNGTAVWWTFDKLKISFFRPLTEITHWIDYQLWPDSPALMHIHNLLWFGLLAIAVTAFYRQILGATWIAGLAAMLYVLDDARGIPVGWIANRSAIISTLFGVLAITLHAVWRLKKRRIAAVGASTLILLSLFSAEYGTGSLAYLLAFECTMVEDKWSNRVRALLPYLAITLLWGGYYSYQGFGAYGSTLYSSPITNPTGFIQALLERIPILLWGQWFFPDSAIYGIMPAGPARILWMVATVALLGLTVVLWPLLIKNRTAKFWAIGMMLSLVPIASPVPANRLLFFTGLGGMGLLAAFFAAWVDNHPWRPASRGWRIAARGYLVIFVMIHIIVSPGALWKMCTRISQFSNELAKTPIISLIESKKIAQKTAIFVNPPVPVFITDTQWYLLNNASLPNAPKQLWLLASNLDKSLALRRLNPYEIELSSDDGLITTVRDGYARDVERYPMEVGYSVKTSDMTATVVELTKTKRPLRVRFTFNKRLDDPEYVFLMWQAPNFEPLTLPPVGKTVIIKPTRQL